MWNWIVLLISLIACVKLARADHPGSDIDGRRATPGLELEITELTTGVRENLKRYRLHATGFPRAIVFGVFTKTFGNSFEERLSGFEADSTNRLVATKMGNPKRLEDFLLEQGLYPRGAIWEVAIVSADRTISAFAKTTPNPIIAHDGSCTLMLELVSKRGLRFVASGSGFTGGGEVSTESSFAGRVLQQRHRIPSDGKLPLQVISYGSPEADRHASYSVRSRNCNPSVDYEWGARALIPR